MKLPGDEQQHLRSRYTLLKNFLHQAIARCTGFEYGGWGPRAEGCGVQCWRNLLRNRRYLRFTWK